MKVIYQAEYREKDIPQFWFHDDTESEFCKSQYLNLRNDYDVDTMKAAPVFGPLNLELYWQPA
ncbi:hypothetical protein NELLIE_56 [Arthrobacter phage Nellie]|nr:hypothetical protein NELLIE_56 [Arthrobacter phage Nellie]